MVVEIDIVKEIAAVLFEDAPYDTKQQNYVQQLIHAMIKTLKNANAEKILL